MKEKLLLLVFLLAVMGTTLFVGFEILNAIIDSADQEQMNFTIEVFNG